MEDEIQNKTIEETAIEPVKKDYLLPASILISALIIAGAWVYTAGLKVSNAPQKVSNNSVNQQKTQKSAIEEKVLPSEGVVLPIRWSDLGVKMVSVGVIDKEKLESLYVGRGGLRLLLVMRGIN